MRRASHVVGGIGLAALALLGAGCSGGYTPDRAVAGEELPAGCEQVVALREAFASSTSTGIGSPSGAEGRTAGTARYGTADPTTAGSPTTAADPAGSAEAQAVRARQQAAVDAARPSMTPEASAAFDLIVAGGPTADTPPGSSLTPMVDAIETARTWSIETCAVDVFAAPTGAGSTGGGATVPPGPTGSWPDLRATLLAAHPDAVWVAVAPSLSGTIGRDDTSLNVTVTGVLTPEAAEALCRDVRSTLGPTAPAGHVVVIVKVPDVGVLSQADPTHDCTRADP